MPESDYYSRSNIISSNQPSRVVVEVVNTGPRPIQVGSHAHFYDIDEALTFERDVTKGYRLNIAPSTSIRFMPGKKRRVELVDYTDSMECYGQRPKPAPLRDRAPSPSRNPVLVLRPSALARVNS
ncbi:MAG: urease subunit beta [Pseudomonadota bacterium]